MSCLSPGSSASKSFIAPPQYRRILPSSARISESSGRWTPSTNLTAHEYPGSPILHPGHDGDHDPACNIEASRSGRGGGSVGGRLQRLRDDLRDVGHRLDLQRVE